MVFIDVESDVGIYPHQTPHSKNNHRDKYGEYGRYDDNPAIYVIDFVRNPVALPPHNVEVEGSSSSLSADSLRPLA